jgi:hypothetical protein
MDLSVPTELFERGDTASKRGLGRLSGCGLGLSVGAFTRGDAGGEDNELSNLIPSFHAGGEGTWKRSWPLSSERCAICVLDLFEYQV